MRLRSVERGAIRLGLSSDPTTLALLVLLDQTVSRLDRDGRILGAWVGTSQYLDDVPDAQLDSFEDATGLNVADMLDEESKPVVLGAIAESLRTSQPVVVEYETRFTGRLLHLVGRCAPCGENEVLWLTRDLTPQHLARQAELARADLEAAIGGCLHSLIDVGRDGLDHALDKSMHDIADHFGAESAFVRRFRGRARVEVGHE